MPRLALILFALYMVLIVGLRALVQRRRTGSSGFRLAKFPRGAELVSGPLVTFGFLGLPFGAWAQHRGWVRPLIEVGPIWVAAAVAGLVVGAIATFLCQLALGDAWRIGVQPGERTPLVTDGVYRWVRNPIYTAVLGSLLAVAALAPNPLTLAAWVSFGLAMVIQVRAVEEPHLARLHGREFDQYRAKTGRFLPGIGRSAANGSSRTL